MQPMAEEILPEDSPEVLNLMRSNLERFQREANVSMMGGWT